MTQEKFAYLFSLKWCIVGDTLRVTDLTYENHAWSADLDYIWSSTNPLRLAHAMRLLALLELGECETVAIDGTVYRIVWTNHVCDKLEAIVSNAPKKEIRTRVTTTNFE